jgi:hypothetical protein
MRRHHRTRPPLKRALIWAPIVMVVLVVIAAFFVAPSLQPPPPPAPAAEEGAGRGATGEQASAAPSAEPARPGADATPPNVKAPAVKAPVVKRSASAHHPPPAPEPPNDPSSDLDVQWNR